MKNQNLEHQKETTAIFTWLHDVENGWNTAVWYLSKTMSGVFMPIFNLLADIPGDGGQVL